MGATLSSVASEISLMASDISLVIGSIKSQIYDIMNPEPQYSLSNPYVEPQRSEEERDASVVRHVRYALSHYNLKNPGAEFDLVKPLMAACVIFRGQTWVHVSFWGRRTGAPPGTAVKQFFGELHYSCLCEDPVVETCTIVDKISTFQPTPIRKKKKPRKRMCTICPRSFEIFHPKKGKFVCGKEGRSSTG